MAKLLKGFAYVWAFLIFISILLSIIGSYLRTRSILETWSWFTDTFSPFNIWNVLLCIILLSPAYIAFLIAKKLEKKEKI